MTDLLGHIWKQTFKDAPTLSQEEVLEVFAEMDETLRQTMLLCMDCPLVISDIMLMTAAVAGSLSHGKAIFERGFAIAREPKKPKRSVQNWHANQEPGILFRYRAQPDTDALAFLHASLSLYNAWANGHLEPHHMYAARLSRASLEKVVDRFISVVGSYEQDSMELTRLRAQYLGATGQEAADLLLELSRVNDKLMRIQDSVSMTHELYGRIVTIQDRMKHYKKLRDKIYIPYLRVVFDEAKKRAASEIQTIENFQNGSVGLIAAISNYNPKRGVFSSYARQWAMQGVLLKLKEEANAIKLPPAVWQTASKLNEIAKKHASLSVDGSVDMDAVSREAGIDTERAEKILERVRSTQMLSIDFEPDDPDAQSLHETIEAEVDAPPPDIRHYLDGLSEQQRFLVLLNNGCLDMLPGGFPTEKDDLNKERLRQLIANAVNTKAALVRG